MAFFGLDIGALIADAIVGSMLPLLASMEFNNDLYKFYFRVIYPKWLCLKRKIKYNIIRQKQYRHIQQENKRLVIGVMIRND